MTWWQGKYLDDDDDNDNDDIPTYIEGYYMLFCTYVY